MVTKCAKCCVLPFWLAGSQTLVTRDPEWEGYERMVYETKYAWASADFPEVEIRVCILVILGVYFIMRFNIAVSQPFIIDVNMKLVLACLLPLTFFGQHALGNPSRTWGPSMIEPRLNRWGRSVQIKQMSHDGVRDSNSSCSVGFEIK